YHPAPPPDPGPGRRPPGPAPAPPARPDGTPAAEVDHGISPILGDPGAARAAGRWGEGVEAGDGGQAGDGVEAHHSPTGQALPVTPRRATTRSGRPDPPPAVPRALASAAAFATIAATSGSVGPARSGAAVRCARVLVPT